MSLTRSQLDQIVLEEIKTTLVEVSPGQFASPESRAKYKEKARRLRARNVEKSGEKPAAPKKEPPKRKRNRRIFHSDEAQMMWNVGDRHNAWATEFQSGNRDSIFRRYGAESPSEIYDILTTKFDFRGTPEDKQKLISAIEARSEKIRGGQKADAPKSTDLTASTLEPRIVPSGGPNVELDLTDDAIKAVEDKVIDNISDPALKNKAEKAKKASAGTLATIVSNVGKPGTWSPAEYKRLKNAGFSDEEIVSLKQMFIKGSEKIAAAEPERGDLVAAATLLARGITPDQLKLAKYKEKDWLKDMPASAKALGPGWGRGRKNKKSAAAKAPPGSPEKSTTPLGRLWAKRYSEARQLDLSRLLELIDDEIRNFKNIN